MKSDWKCLSKGCSNKNFHYSGFMKCKICDALHHSKQDGSYSYYFVNPNDSFAQEFDKIITYDNETGKTTLSIREGSNPPVLYTDHGKLTANDFTRNLLDN